MEATRARPSQTNTRPAPSAVQKSAGPSKAVVSVAGKAPLYTGAPAVRLGTPAPGPVTGPSQAEVSEQIGQLVNAPGTGEPLRPEIQKSLENSLEVDLSPVRVHTDERSAAVADNLNARAFTYGPHIFLGSRERQTDLALMAHEVTHVIQQQGAPVLQMSSAPAAPDTFEREAQQVSATVQQGGQANVTGRTVGQQVQKEDVPWYKRAARAVGRGASAVGAAVVKGAEAVVEWGENVGWSLLNKYAPDLVPIIRQGVGEWLKEKISSAIETVFNTLMAPVRAVTGVVQSLMAHFTELLAWMREAASEIARGDCSAITKAVDKVQKVIEGIASPIIDRVKHLAQKVGDFFKGLWERFGAPIWDFLKKVGGAIWEKIQRFGNWVWEKTQPIRDLLSRAWKWIKDKLGVGDEPEGQNGLLQWVQKKAAAAWDWLKAKIEPIKKPLMVVAGVLVMLSPAGPIIAIGAAVGGLIMGIRWIRQHLNTPDGVVKNRGVLQGVIIPGIMNAVKGLTGKLSSIAASIIEKLNKVMGGLGDLVGAVGGSILRFAVSAVKWIADQFQGLVQWGSEKLHGLVDWISNGLHRLHVFLQPILDVLAKVGEVIVDILKLPGLIIGKVWKIIPACIRDPFVDFLINQILKRLPFFNQLTEIGEIWSKIKNGAMTAIRQVFKEGDLKGAMVTVFKLMLDLLKVPLQLVVAIFSKAGSVLDLIIANPKGFLINVLLALKEGFVNFFKNILTHLINGVIGWLTSELKDVNITVEGSLTDLWSIFKLVLQVLGLSVERVFERLGKKIGEDKVEKLKKMFKVLSGVWDWITAVMTEGLAGLWKKIKEQLTNLYDLLLDSVIGWVTEKIIGEVTKQILSMLDPTGIMAVVKSIIALYRGIQSFLRYLTRMLQIINTILDSLLGLAKGEISPAAVLLEQAMDKAMAVVIGFLANQIGLGGIGKRIQEIIKKVHEKVDKAIDWLIDKAVNGGKALLNSLGLGGGKPDERTPEQKQKDLDKGMAEAQQLLEDENKSPEQVKKGLQSIKGTYRVATLELVTDNMRESDETDHIHGENSPGKDGKKVTKKKGKHYSVSVSVYEDPNIKPKDADPKESGASHHVPVKVLAIWVGKLYQMAGRAKALDNKELREKGKELAENTEGTGLSAIWLSKTDHNEAAHAPGTEEELDQLKAKEHEIEVYTKGDKSVPSVKPSQATITRAVHEHEVGDESTTEDPKKQMKEIVKKITTIDELQILVKKVYYHLLAAGIVWVQRVFEDKKQKEEVDTELRKKAKDTWKDVHNLKL